MLYVCRYVQYYVNMIEDTMRTLVAAQSDPAELKEVQKQVGFNFCPRGLLMNPLMSDRTIGAIMYDWMHIYVVRLSLFLFCILHILSSKC